MATLFPPHYEALRKYGSETVLTTTEKQGNVNLKGSLPLSTNQNDSLAEIRVSTADKMAFHVKLKFGSDSTADSVLELTLARLDIELELGKEIFALWIVSNNLELQLTPTHKPVKVLLQWRGLINSYTDLSTFQAQLEVPIVTLRRSAYCQLRVERNVENIPAQNLLFSEAKKNFLSARYTFPEMRDTFKLGAYLVLAEMDSQSDLSLDWIRFKNRISEFLPIKFPGKKAPLDISTNARKMIVCKQLLTSIQTQQAKGHNPYTLRTLFLQSCQHLSIYGAVFFQAVVERPVGFFSKLTFRSRDRDIFVALNASILHIIDSDTNEAIFKLYYDHFSWLYQPPSRSGDCQYCSVWIEFDSVMENSLSVAKQLQIFSKQSSFMDSIMRHHVAQLNQKATPPKDNPNRHQTLSAFTINEPMKTPHCGERNFSLLSFSMNGEEIPNSRIRRGMTSFKKSISSH